MNLSVFTPDECLSFLDMPSLQPANNWSSTPADLLIVSAGFEDRVLASLYDTSFSSNLSRIVLVEYKPYCAENKLDEILRACSERNIQAERLVYDREEPAGFGVLLARAVCSCGGRVFIDVSGMSRLLIVQSIVALGARSQGFKNCFVVYAEALEYPPTEEQAKSELAKCDSDPTFTVLFLSSGVFEITVVPELSSFAPSATQTRLIAFPSLDAHQLTALRSEVQPSRFSFIEGVPPNDKNKWRQKVISEINCINDFGEAEISEASTFDYRQTLHILLRLYSAHSVRERLLISPTGSKMQAVAVGVFRAVVKDVQIVYPTPHSFHKPTEYTLGVGPMHILPLEAFSAALESPDIA